MGKYIVMVCYNKTLTDNIDKILMVYIFDLDHIYQPNFKNKLDLLFFKFKNC